MVKKVKAVEAAKIGAHLSIAGGYGEALQRVVALGGNCLQMFSASPRGWNIAKVSGADAKEFVAAKERLGVDPVYFHASYLINLADKGSVGHLSKESLVAELSVAGDIGVRGSIVHLGSFKMKSDEPVSDAQYEVLCKNIKTVLEKTPARTILIIENAGTRKIGRDLTEIAKIIDAIGDKRVHVCLDTCHLHAAGYDLRSEAALDTFLKTFDNIIGLSRLELFHVNDSRDPFGSLRDRHDNIGEGAVGREVFELLLNHPKTKDLPFVTEVPGFDDNGPDKENIDRLKAMVR